MPRTSTRYPGIDLDGAHVVITGGAQGIGRQTAEAVVGSVASRRAEIAVPRYVGGLAAAAAVTPEPVLNGIGRLMRDDRALQPDSAENFSLGVDSAAQRSTQG
jgi:NAD(P)-dependent dehydrogenase (short-subunit alcohol dehydrogenase family)